MSSTASNPTSAAAGPPPDRPPAGPPTPPTPAEGWRGNAALLAFGTFVVGTDAFVIAGVLPDIAHSLGLSLGAAGQLVTVFAIAYALGSPLLAAATAGWSRRAVLVTALVVFAVGNAATAVAPGYVTLLAARVLAAVGAALYTPNAATTAGALAGNRHRGRAFSIVNIGLTTSLVLGAPLGTVVGETYGWRATMWLVTILPLLVAPLLAVRLPRIRLAAGAGLRARLAPLGDRRVLGVLATTLVVFIGIYLPFQYISAVYGPAASQVPHGLAIVLLIFGVAATAGNLLAGRLADRYGAQRVVVAVAAALTVAFVLMPLTRGQFVAAAPFTLLIGWLSFSVLTPQQHRIVTLAPEAQAVTVSLNAAAVYVAVSLAGVLGAVGVDTGGATLLPVAAAVFTAAGTALAAAAGRRPA
ncbi:MULTISPECIES: MFS transporter [unclassified Streptomyces]|uniref:MFS transporter n=1 Tax=unclassified Streptomyces TaxID=2593676 RepID=UPI002E2450B8|nr:MFS transporter [Streptomyces sp. NBC_01023]